jgi:hypothetical protein
MFLRRKFYFTAFAIFLFTGCSYDKEELLLPPCPDAVGNISFAIKVKPLLDSKCFGCHNNSNRMGSISLEGYDNIRQSAITGKLYGSISHAPGFYPMPKFKPKMAECDIALVRKWIDNGALNN